MIFLWIWRIFSGVKYLFWTRQENKFVILQDFAHFWNLIHWADTCFQMRNWWYSLIIPIYPVRQIRKSKYEAKTGPILSAHAAILIATLEKGCQILITNDQLSPKGLKMSKICFGPDWIYLQSVQHYEKYWFMLGWWKR